MKLLKPILVGVAGGLFIAALGIVGHMDYVTELRQEVVDKCSRSGGQTLTSAGQECNRLVREMEQSGYTLRYNDTQYWTENTKAP